MLQQLLRQIYSETSEIAQNFVNSSTYDYTIVQVQCYRYRFNISTNDLFEIFVAQASTKLKV